MFLWSWLRPGVPPRLDPLTGLPSRQAFLEASEAELIRSRRTGRPLTLAHLDLDDFRALNERLGHAAGDEVLKTVASTLKTRLRRTDVLARLGSDEFGLLLPETGLADAKEPLETLRKALTEALKDKATFSLAARSYVQTPASVDEMLKGTGDLMRSLKSSGKNRSEHA